MRRIAFSTMMIVACIMMCAGCRRGPVLKAGRLGEEGLARIEGNSLIVSGRGRRSGRSAFRKPGPDEKILLLRAARMDALRNTLRELDLSQTVVRGSEKYERVKGIVRGARLLREDWIDSNQVRVTLKVPLNGPGSLAEGLEFRKISSH